MKKLSALLLLTVTLIPAAAAQEGHPLAGTWQGYWGESPGERNFLTLIMQWDGETISGVVNPGPNAGTIREVRLDSSSWTVAIDLNVEDRAGETVRVTGTGRLENIGAPDRMIRGSLESGGGSYFKISRQ